MKKELEPCPVCKGEDLDYNENPNGKLYIRCRTCTFNWNGEIEGTDRWNLIGKDKE